MSYTSLISKIFGRISLCNCRAPEASPYLPEVVHLAVDQRLVLSLDVVDVPDVAGVEVLLHHEA